MTYVSWPYAEVDMQLHDRKMIFGPDNDNALGERLIQQVLDRVKTAMK